MSPLLQISDLIGGKTLCPESTMSLKMLDNVFLSPTMIVVAQRNVLLTCTEPQSPKLRKSYLLQRKRLDVLTIIVPVAEVLLVVQQLEINEFECSSRPPAAPSTLNVDRYDDVGSFTRAIVANDDMVQIKPPETILVIMVATIVVASMVGRESVQMLLDGLW